MTRFNYQLLTLLFVSCSILLIVACGKDDNGGGSSGSQTLTASFDISSDLFTDVPVVFTNTSKGATVYEWNFGDGTTSTERSPSHTYASEGSYTVVLKSSNASGSSKTASRDIKIESKVDLSASFTIPDGDLYTETDILFTNTSAGAIAYEWRFGDGGTSTDESPKHQYANAGNYEVTLIAKNDEGESKETKVTVVILKKPEPILITNCNQFGDLTWTDHNPNGVDYIVNCELKVKDGRLTIEENVTVEFGSNAALSIVENGSLVTKTNSLLTSKTKAPGSWKGVELNDCKVVNLNGTTIEYAGELNTFIEDRGETKGSLIFKNTVSSVHDCLIRHSSSNGVVFSGLNSDFSQGLLENCTISNCSDAGIVTNLLALNFATNASLSECGTDDRIHVYESALSTGIAVLKKNKFFVEGHLGIATVVQFSAGSDIVLGTGITIGVSGSGQLNLKGTPDEMITIKGENAGQVTWGAIIVGTSRDNTFEYCNFQDGGTIPLPLFFGGVQQGRPAMIYMSSGSKLNILNSNFSNTFGCAVASYLPNPDFVSVGNTFEDIPLSGAICNIN